MKKIPSDMIAGTIHETNNFGSLEVVKYENHANVTVLFPTGYIAIVQSIHIILGMVKDKLSKTVFKIGFIGSGKFKPKSGSVLSKEYILWSSMLSRCYNSKNKSYKDYGLKGVLVHPDWHNFQNFAEWYHDNIPNKVDGYELDKDELSPLGKKEYSPLTCQFITKSRNIEISHAKEFTFKSPGGDVIKVFNLSKFCRENYLHQGAMSRVFSGKSKHHKGWMKI